MSQYKSPYIAGSSHTEGTAAVDKHFFASDNKEAVGESSGRKFQPGMTSAWDTTPMPVERGLVNSAPTGARSGPSIFNDNIERVPIPKGTGVNYKPLSQAGNNLMADKPFGGARDGYAGNTPNSGVKKLIWD